MKNTPRKNPTEISTLIGSLQLIIHFLLVSPSYWVCGQKKTHLEELSNAELSYWAKTKFGKSNKEIYQEPLNEDYIAAMQFHKDCVMKGYPF